MLILLFNIMHILLTFSSALLSFHRVKQMQSELGSQIISDFEEAFQGSGAKV